MMYVIFCSIAYIYDKYKRGSTDYLGYLTFKRLHAKTNDSQEPYRLGTLFDNAYLTTSDVITVAGIAFIVGLILVGITH